MEGSAELLIVVHVHHPPRQLVRVKRLQVRVHGRLVIHRVDAQARLVHGVVHKVQDDFLVSQSRFSAWVLLEDA